MTNEVETDRKKSDDEISIKDIIISIRQWGQYVWMKKWVIVASGIIGAVLGLGYALIKKPTYTASTTFVLETGEKSGLAAYAGLASMVGIDLGANGGGIFQGDNIIELYKSRLMIERTLFSPLNNTSKKPIIDGYIKMNKLRKKWEGKPELEKLQFSLNDLDEKNAGINRSRLKDSVIYEIVEEISKSNLVIGKPDKKLSIIKVDVKAKDEDFAKRFNEELVKNVNDFYVQTKTKKSVENVQILQRKTDSVRAVMNGAINTAVIVADATPNLNPTRQVQRAAPVQRAQFSAETNKAVLGELVKNLEMAKLTLMKETPLIQVVDEPIYPLKKEKVGKIFALVLGGILGGFLTICFYLIKGYLRSIVNT